MTKRILSISLHSFLVALALTLTLGACGDDKKKTGGEMADNQSALASPTPPAPEEMTLPHGDIDYACKSIASSSGVDDPMSWTADCIEIVSINYRMCGDKSKGDAMVQCVNSARGGDQLAGCLAACEP